MLDEDIIRRVTCLNYSAGVSVVVVVVVVVFPKGRLPKIQNNKSVSFLLTPAANNLGKRYLQRIAP